MFGATTTATRWWHRWVTVAAVVVVAMLGTTPAAYGQTYGFDQSCDQIHDSLDQVPVPGVPSMGDAASAACKAGNAATHPDQAAAAVRDKAWDTSFGKIVDSLMNGLGEALILALTFWMRIPADPSQGGALLSRITDYTYQLQVLLLMVSVIVSGVRIAQARRGAAGSEAVESFRLFARVVFASWMFGAVLVAGTVASDRFSAWVIQDVTGGNAQAIAAAMVKTTQLQAFSPGLVLVITIVGLLGALAQLVLAIVRQALLLVAAGILPLAAAAGGTATGRRSYDKLIGWILAFLLYKPLAALVYMIAFVTFGTTGADIPAAGLPDSEQAQRMLVSIVLLCSAAFVLPALLRLVAPTVAAVGMGGSGLGATAGTLGAAALVATSTGSKARPIAGLARRGAGRYAPRGTGLGGGGGTGRAARTTARAYNQWRTADARAARIAAARRARPRSAGPHDIDR